MFRKSVSRRMNDYHRDMRSRARKRFIRSAILGVGFLSGLWAHFGLDPQTWVATKLESLLLSVGSAQEIAIKLVFLYGPIIFSLITMLLIYRRAGLWGFVATGLAYLAGLWLNALSPVLLGLALLIAIVSVRR